MFRRLTGYSKGDNEELKEALRTLRRTEFEYNILHKDSEEWTNFSFCGDVTIKSKGRGAVAKVEREFPSRVLNVIKNPNMYVRLNLLLLMGLESKHSIVLYEFLKDYINL